MFLPTAIIDFCAERQKLPKILLYILGVPSLSLHCFWLFLTTVILPKIYNWFGFHLQVPGPFDWNYYTLQMKRFFRDIQHRSAFVGKPAPNPGLLSFETKNSVSLLDYQTCSRPLIVAFGSCT